MRKIYTLIAFCFLAGQFLLGQINFSYTASVQTWVVPATGNYQLEVWGAQGGNGLMPGGKGGYAKGIKYLTAGTTLYIYVGGQGNTDSNTDFANVNGGYNGGGGIRRYGNNASSGGGASDISTVGGEATLDGFFRWARTAASYNGRIIVGAGGGGRGGSNTTDGDGGGLNGIGGEGRSTGIKESAQSNVMTGGYGTQTSGGNAELYPSPDFDTYAANSAPGSFGLGGTYYSMHSSNTAAGGGGGGYYGGGVNCHGDGGGGSSYIGGVSDGSTTAGVRSGDGYVTITPLVPVVTTTAISSVTTTTASSGGDVTADNGNAASARGVCWGTTNPPTISNSKTTDGSGLGAFTSSITGLTAGTTYYVRAYATNVIGTGYGSVETFTTLKNSQTITFTDDLSTKTYGDASFDLTGTASSTLTVSYASSNTDVATISGSTVTILAQGTSTITASQAGNASYSAATSVPQTLTVAKKVLTVTGAVGDNKVYDGNANALVKSAALVGIVGEDDVQLDVLGGTFVDVNVAEGIGITPALTLKGTAVGNYTLTQPEGLIANITPKELTVTGAMGVNKVYDGNTDAVLKDAVLVGVVGEDDVQLDALVGSFESKSVANAVAVTSALTLKGNAIANYTLTQPTGLTANITAKELSLSNVVVQDKEYDGTTDAVIVDASFVGLVANDDVQIDETIGTFADKNVGTGIAVTPALTLKGLDVENYSFSQPVELTANIIAKELTVENAIALDKVYDGNADAVLVEASLMGVVGEEDVQFDALTASFDDANVGAGIDVTTTITLKGADLANYTLAQPIGLAAEITPKELTVTSAVGVNKVYDGNTTAAIDEAILVGKVGNDDVALDALAGTFADKNVGNGIAVTPALTLKGAAKANYTLAQPAELTADITKAALTVTAQDASRKEGIANAAFSIEYSGFVNSEDKSVLDTQPVASSVADASSAPGDYDITVSGGVDNNYNFTYVGATLTVTSTVGIPQSDLKVKVYPNPFVSELYINSENLPANAVAKLYDMNGRNLMNFTLDGQAINLAHLRSGVYLLKIEGNSYRIVKQ